MINVQITVSARQTAEPSNDNMLDATASLDTTKPLDFGLALTLFGLVAVTFALMGYTLATGPEDIMSVLRR